MGIIANTVKELSSATDTFHTTLSSPTNLIKDVNQSSLNLVVQDNFKLSSPGFLMAGAFLMKSNTNLKIAQSITPAAGMMIAGLFH